MPALAWSTARDVSPIDDSAIVQAFADATTTYEGMRGTERATLVLHCESNTTLLVLQLPGLFVSDLGAWGEVTFRVDTEAAAKVSMVAGNDNGSLALRSGGAIQAAKAMLAGESLFVRVLPVNEKSVDIRFNLKGMATAVKPVREACGW